MYTFDTYTSAAPQDSGQWATSDRGWLYIEDADGAVRVRGYYLSYGDLPHRPAFVLAMAYDSAGPVDYAVHSHYRNKDCANVEEARAWLVEQVVGQLALV